jgi:beta-phosphoglucomutase-like phosphatase (HAD superfamily)
MTLLPGGPVDAVVFDLDGVLADSEIWWREVRDELAAAHGQVLHAADHEGCVGLNSAAWSALLAERLGQPAAEIESAVVGGMLARYWQRPAPSIPGAIEAARLLVAGRRAAIASGAHPAILAAAVASLGIEDLVEVVVSADEVPAGKPAPDVYLLAARRLGVEPARAVAIEDSLNGALAARSAGLRVVLVPNGHVPPAPGAGKVADLVIAHLSELRLPPAGDGRA